MTLALLPDWSATAVPFPHTWAPIANIDQFRWLVRTDVREHLRMARDELGVRYVRACAMYSPELRVWTHSLPDWRMKAAERPHGANWQNVDLGIENLLELGLKPIYTTCFMPAAFTDATATCWPDRNPVGMPRDLDQWSTFVADGLRHHVARFGLEEVRSWYFECWNEPNLGGFFAGSRDDFFRLWSATWKAVKSVDAGFRFGGPSTARGEWLSEFLDFTAGDGTSPDYLISHVYNNDSESQPLSPFDGPASHRVKDSPHFSTGVIRGVRRELTQRGWAGEVHWNEWGRSWFPHDPAKEGPLEAAFVVKTMAEVAGEADAFAFWCLSDVYDQVGYQSAEFQGNYGMCSLHGLRKPAWKAHQLLQRLGTFRLPVDGGGPLHDAIATRSPAGVQVLVWRYPEQVGVAGSSDTVEVELPAGPGAVTVWRIGEEENSTVARWRAMGAPAYPTASQLAELRAMDHLQPARDQAVVDEGLRRRVRFTLECPGVALIEALDG